MKYMKDSANCKKAHSGTMYVIYAQKVVLQLHERPQLQAILAASSQVHPGSIVCLRAAEIQVNP